MARRRRKRETRPTDQADYQACISWQRIFVASVMSDRSLTLAISGFLVDTRPIVESAPECRLTPARSKLREAWRWVRQDELWFAVVRALEARALAGDDPSPDRRAVEGRALCDALRKVYPKAPPGFERTGRTASGGE